MQKLEGPLTHAEFFYPEIFYSGQNHRWLHFLPILGNILNGMNKNKYGGLEGVHDFT